MGVQENRVKWAKALLSGDYKQWKYRLKTNSKYCCLGVLCELYRKETGKGKWKGGAVKVFEIGNVSKVHEPPKAVLEWAGLENSDITIFTVANDMYLQSFKEIAKTVLALK